MIAVADSVDDVEHQRDALIESLHKDSSGLRLDGSRIEIGQRRRQIGQATSHVEDGRKLVTSEDVFGNIDGISDPRFFTFDVRDVRPIRGPERWPEGRSPRLVLVPDSAAGGYGSFFVFQKIRQNTARYRARAPDASDVAALLGRYPDGTLKWHHDVAAGWARQFNDFNWEGGRHQPPIARDFQPHIRAVNDRKPDGPVLARRSMPYVSTDDGDQGLLFGAYTSDLERNFVAMEEAARKVGDPFVPGPDTDVVTLLGGEYFYAPPPQFFSRLSQDVDS